MKLWNGTNEIWDLTLGNTDFAKQAFGDRLSVDTSKINEVAVTIKNTSLTDSGLTLNLTGGFIDKLFKVIQFGQNRITLVVEGKVCPKVLVMI